LYKDVVRFLELHITKTCNTQKSLHRRNTWIQIDSVHLWERRIKKVNLFLPRFIGRCQGSSLTDLIVDVVVYIVGETIAMYIFSDWKSS